MTEASNNKLEKQHKIISKKRKSRWGRKFLNFKSSFFEKRQQ